jgi:uncharacterized protein (TIGR02217 family)
MSFIESPRFPEEVSGLLVGGEEFTTDIAMTQGGSETRNMVWSAPLRHYRLSNALRTMANAQATKAFFRAMGGRANGFRVKDIYDFTCDATNGTLLGAGSSSIGVGAGVPVYQLYKTYALSPLVSYGIIKKPVVGQVTVNRNGTPVVVGAGAGQIAIDTTTGLITFVADASSAATAITVGTTTQVTLSTNPNSLIAGKKLYLNNFTGADAALVNGIAHTINSVAGAGPYVFTLATNTLGKTITLGTGAGYAYPQASDALTWVGQFDIPVRFDVDWLQIGIDTGLMLWDNITLIELRNP